MEQSYIALHDSFLEAVNELQDSYARMQRHLLERSIKVGMPVSDDVIKMNNTENYELTISRR